MCSFSPNSFCQKGVLTSSLEHAIWGLCWYIFVRFPFNDPDYQDANHHQDYEPFLVGNPNLNLHLWLLLVGTTQCMTVFAVYVTNQRFAFPATFISSPSKKWITTSVLQCHFPPNQNKSMYIYIYLVWPPPCTSHHQDFSIFSRGFLLTFTFHCYREGAISNIYIWVCLKMRLPGREVCLRGLFRGSVSWYVSGVCFGGLFRTVLLPRTVKFKESVEGLFRGMFRGSVSPKSNFQALLKVALPKKMQTHIYIYTWSRSPVPYSPAHEGKTCIMCRAPFFSQDN